MDKKPTYELKIDGKDNLVFANSLVDEPAHMKNFIAFSKNGVSYKFNEEKRMVVGVVMTPNMKIFRNADERNGLPEHYVFFSEKTVEDARKFFHINKFQDNINPMHTDKNLKGVFMIDSYIAGGKNNPQIPVELKNQNLAEGTWIASYYIENEEVWQSVKDGTFKGFSMEGVFDMIETKEFKQQNKMSKKTKTLKELIFGKENKFATATTVDGVEIQYEGTLEVGTAVMVAGEEGEEPTPAPEGEHQVEVEGTVFLITLDDQGVVQSMTEVTDEEMTAEEVTEAMRSMKADYEKQIASLKKESEDTFKAMKKDLDFLKEGKDNKFKANGKKTGGEKGKGFKALMNKN